MSVSLQLAFPKVFVAGFGSFFHARLVNQGEERLHSTVVTFVCPDFDPPEVAVPFEMLTPGAYQDVTVSVHPQRAGSRPLTFVIEFGDKDISAAQMGNWEGMTVFEKPANEINVTNIIRDVQSHRSSGDKAEFGAVKGDVSINVTNSLGDVRTLNDLLAAAFPVQFQPMRLRGLSTTEISSVSDRRRIPHALLRVFEPMNALALFHHDAAAIASGDPALRGWRLRGGGQPLVIGRSSAEADLVSRFMPPTASHDTMSAGMSRKHARLSVTREGQLQVENITSGNAVMVGPQFVPSGALMLLNSGQHMSLGTAPADLRLAVHLRPALHQEARVINLHEWAGNGSTTHHPEVERPAWGHASFEWPNSAPSHWHTVWFTRTAPFGSATDAAVCLKDEGGENRLASCHGFFHHFRGCYWLEVISTRGEVTLSDPHVQDGRPVPLLPGQLAPLRGGMTLTLGRHVLSVSKAA